MNIDTLQLELRVLLGKMTLPMIAVLELRKGDILILEQKLEKSLHVEAGEKVLFLATPGLYEIHKAVYIDERIYPR